MTNILVSASCIYIFISTAQLLCLTQSHTIVAVVGECCSGKSSVIKVAANALRGQGSGLTVSWIVPGALDEGELFGKDIYEQ